MHDMGTLLLSYLRMCLYESKRGYQGVLWFPLSKTVAALTLYIHLALEAPPVLW